MKSLQIMGILMLLCSIWLFIVMIYGVVNIYKDFQESPIKIVDCYDKYGNQILGLTCEKEITDDIFFIIFPFAAVFFIGFFGIEFIRDGDYL